MTQRVYNFCGLAYQEHWEELRQYLTSYTARGTIQFYAFILHKPDDEDSEPHIHFMITYYDAKTLTSIYKKLKTFRNGLIQICNDPRGYARYLIHMDEPDKIRYYPDSVETNDMEKYRMYINSENTIQCSADKQLFRKFRLYVQRGYSLDYIWDLLCDDKEFKIKDIRKNAYFFRVYYEKYHKEGGEAYDN